MAEIRPFKAVRYADGLALENLVTQPYDRIPLSLKQTYLSRSPHNLVNLLLPDEERARRENKDKYRLAADLFRAWLDRGTLVRDSAPGFYPYRQTFELDGAQHVRTGFIGLCKVEEYGRRIVFPHERTLAKPKADRLSLLSVGRVHYGLIFLLYEDDGAAQQVIDDCTAGPPRASVTDDFNVRNELWRITGHDALHELRASLSDKELFIADGHHRYETSLIYAREHQNDLSAQYTLAMFVNIESPLVVLPTHRAIHRLSSYSPSGLRAKLENEFALRPCGTLEETIAATRSSGDGVCIGCFDGEAFWAATLKDENAMRRAAPEHSDAWRGLDVAVLHTLIIEEALGITPERVEQESAVSYHRDPVETVELVKEGKASCAFFLKATRPAQVCEVARGREVMPQKSTDFYPKVLTGLAMYTLD